jgi:hypothetical protein
VSKEKKYGVFSAHEVGTHFVSPGFGTIILLAEEVLDLEERRPPLKSLIIHFFKEKLSGESFAHHGVQAQLFQMVISRGTNYTSAHSHP